MSSKRSDKVKRSFAHATKRLKLNNLIDFLKLWIREVLILAQES